MSEMQYVTEADFQNEVLNSNEPVLVDFTAVWCQPCKMLDPVVRQLAQDWQGKVKVVKLDADQNPNLMVQYGVMGIPTLMLFKGGNIEATKVGALSKSQLTAFIDSHL